MNRLIEKITPAIMNSRKLHVRLQDGHLLLVHPHIVVRKKKGEEILKTMLDNGDCLDIPLNKISRISVMPDFFAINARCLDFNHHECELVFPKREDLLTYGHELVK
jgi:hypothetical protein